MIESGAIYPFRVKDYFLVHPECTIGCTSCGAINEGLPSNKSFIKN